MHSGLKLPNNEFDEGYFEVKQFLNEVKQNSIHFQFNNINYNKKLKNCNDI